MDALRLKNRDKAESEKLVIDLALMAQDCDWTELSQARGNKGNPGRMWAGFLL